MKRVIAGVLALVALVLVVMGLQTVGVIGVSESTREQVTSDIQSARSVGDLERIQQSQGYKAASRGAELEDFLLGGGEIVVALLLIAVAFALWRASAARPPIDRELQDLDLLKRR